MSTKGRRDLAQALLNRAPLTDVAMDEAAALLDERGDARARIEALEADNAKLRELAERGATLAVTWLEALPAYGQNQFGAWLTEAKEALGNE